MSKVKDKKDKITEKTPDKQAGAIKEKAVSKKEEVSQFVVRSNFLRISPSKVRLVANLIKGLPMAEAQTQLIFNPKRASSFLLKILKNAESTAIHNYKLEKEDLYIKNILVNQGPTLHRFKPVARGAAHPIRKRTTHLEVVIGKKLEKEDKKIKKPKGVKEKNLKKVSKDQMIKSNKK